MTWLARERPGRSLIQAPQPGPVYSCAGVLSEEGLVGFACARYLRTWPPEAGNASFARTISPPENLREQVTTLLLEIGWQGLFELELLGRQDGGCMAIDLNPRVYGSMALAARAGAALPAIWCDVLLGRAVTPRVTRPGVSYRWEEGELRNLAALIRSGSVRSFPLRNPRDSARRGSKHSRSLLIGNRSRARMSKPFVALPSTVFCKH